METGVKPVRKGVISMQRVVKSLETEEKRKMTFRIGRFVLEYG
jgi:hypothetical protein